MIYGKWDMCNMEMEFDFMNRYLWCSAVSGRRKTPDICCITRPDELIDSSRFSGIDNRN